jgi:hypothetical protein
VTGGRRRSRGEQAQLGRSGLGDAAEAEARRAQLGGADRAAAAQPLRVGAPQRVGLVAAGRGWPAGSGGWGLGRWAQAQAQGQGRRAQGQGDGR